MNFIEKIKKLFIKYFGKTTNKSVIDTIILKSISWTNNDIIEEIIGNKPNFGTITLHYSDGSISTINSTDNGVTLRPTYYSVIDVNNDGAIDIADISAWSENVKNIMAGYDVDNLQIYDVNNDGQIGIADLVGGNTIINAIMTGDTFNNFYNYKEGTWKFIAEYDGLKTDIKTVNMHELKPTSIDWTKNDIINGTVGTKPDLGTLTVTYNDGSTSVINSSDANVTLIPTYYSNVDGNNDGIIDVADHGTIVNNIKNIMAGYSVENKQMYDINNDGTIDIADLSACVSIIKSIMTGNTIDNFYNYKEGTWKFIAKYNELTTKDKIVKLNKKISNTHYSYYS